MLSEGSGSTGELLWRLRRGDDHGEIRVAHGSVTHNVTVEVAGQTVGRVAVPVGSNWTSVADEMRRVCVQRGWTVVAF
jgi:hypothetical protein